MAAPVDVARYLIHLATPVEDEDADCLSLLRMQKLLYYVQGWHLAACGKPLFLGRIEAWTHGPVVREVYPQFRKFGWSSIPPSEGSDSPDLSPKEKAFVRAVWEQYKKHSAWALSAMTHTEAPWLSARATLGPNEPSEVEITNQSMQAFFSPRLDEWLFREDPRIDKDAWERSKRAIESGQVHTTQEIRRGILRHRAGPDSR
jgi:uncharacterized phage-associated protein